MVELPGGRVTHAAHAPAPATPSLRVRWQWSAFDSLQPRELHASLMLRAAVFVVEQQCAFLDPDVHDVDAWHLLGRCIRGDSSSELAVTLRVLPPGKYAEP